MKITYLGHAAILVEAAGKSIVMDPWLVDPAYCNSWFHYPPLVHRIEDLLPADSIYISHEHPDHFDPATLASVPKDQEFLVPAFTSGVLTERYRRMGFENLRMMAFGEPVELAPDLEVTILRSDLVWEDSAILVKSGGVTLFNMNDCKLGDELLAEVGRVHKPDIVFVPFSGAIHFPTCYEYTPEERAKLCAGRQRKHLDGFVSRVQLLQAPRAVPFAGNFAFLAEDQLWMNEKDANNINTPDQAIELLAEKAPEVEGLQLNPGDVWTLEGGIERHAPAPDFGAKMEQVRAMAAEWAPRLRALRAAEAPARDTLAADFERYFGGIAERHPELCGRIAADIVFVAEGEHGGSWRLSYSDAGLAVAPFSEGDPWNLQITMPASILQRAVDDDICWDEVAISFRCRFAENPEFFNQAFWVMLYNSSPTFLDEYLSMREVKYS